MKNPYSPVESSLFDESKSSIRRTLKRLRIALFVWVVAFVVNVIWFSLRC